MEIVCGLFPELRAAHPSAVVFVSSVLAYDGSRRGAHYAAAKAALVGLATSLARELASEGRVNAGAPGVIDTALPGGDTPPDRAGRGARIPLARVGRPEEVADAVAYLASPRSSHVTGTFVHVNGGLRMG